MVLICGRDEKNYNIKESIYKATKLKQSFGRMQTQAESGQGILDCQANAWKRKSKDEIEAEVLANKFLVKRRSEIPNIQKTRAKVRQNTKQPSAM